MMMRAIFLILECCGLGLIAGCVTATPRRIVFNTAETHYRFVLDEGVPEIDLQSADGLIRSFLIDTGANMAMFNTKRAVAAKARIVDTIGSETNTLGQQRFVHFMHVPALAIDGMRLENFDAAFGELNLGGRFDHEIAGLLSWTLFRDVLLTIDYPARSLHMSNGELPAPDGLDILPLRLLNHQLFFPVSLNNSKVWVMLDTGAETGASIWLTPAQSKGLVWRAPAVSWVNDIAGNPDKLGRMEIMRIGRYEFHEPLVAVYHDRTNCIGADVLRKFAITLDLRHMRVKFFRRSQLPIQVQPALGTEPAIAPDVKKDGLHPEKKVIPFQINRLRAASTQPGMAIAPQMSPGRPEIRYPITLTDNKPFVEGFVDRGRVREFLVDLSAARVSVAAKRPTVHRTVLHRETRDSAEPQQRGETCAISALTLGGARFSGAQIAFDPRLGNVVGWPVFQDCLLTLDYLNSSIVITKGELPPPDGRKVLPVRQIGGDLLFPCSLAGRQLWLRAGTGIDSRASIELTNAQARGLKWLSPPITFLTAENNAASKMRMGRLDGTLQIGAYHVEHPVATIVDGANSGSVDPNVLCNFTLMLDVLNKRIRFTRASDGPIKAWGTCTLGFSFGNEVPPIVKQVMNGSEAARAGVQVGDVLLSINGGTPGPGTGTLLSYEKPVSVRLVRHGRTLAFTFPMTVLVP